MWDRRLWVRRAVIVSLALLAFAYYRSASGSISLAAIGQLAFAAVAQFAPALFAALYWRNASRAGVFWGMLSGFIAWAYLLFLPNLAAGGIVAAQGFAAWPGVLGLLPHSVGDAAGGDAVGTRALLALSLNVLVMLIVSARRGATLQERLAAGVYGGQAYGPFYGASLDLTLGAVGSYTQLGAHGDGCRGRLIHDDSDGQDRRHRPGPHPASSPTATPPQQATVTAFNLGNRSGPGLTTAPGLSP